MITGGKVQLSVGDNRVTHFLILHLFLSFKMQSCCYFYMVLDSWQSIFRNTSQEMLLSLSAQEADALRNSDTEEKPETLSLTVEVFDVDA